MLFAKSPKRRMRQFRRSANQDSLFECKRNTQELLKDKNLPENFIETIHEILKKSIFNLVSKGLIRRGEKVVLSKSHKKHKKKSGTLMNNF
jgi:hypothetical protein